YDFLRPTTVLMLQLVAFARHPRPMAVLEPDARVAALAYTPAPIDDIVIVCCKVRHAVRSAVADEHTVSGRDGYARKCSTVNLVGADCVNASSIDRRACCL